MTPNSTFESELLFVLQLTVIDEVAIPVNCALEIVGGVVSKDGVEVARSVVLAEVVVVFVVVVEVAGLPIPPPLEPGLDGSDT